MIDPLKDCPGYLLRRASAANMVDLGKKMNALELRPTEATVLLAIDANLNATLSDVGRLLEIASANMAPLIARLEERNLVEREPMDGRSHGLSLTPQGRSMTSKIKKMIAEHEAALLEKVPASARSAFLKALRGIWKNE